MCKCQGKQISGVDVTINEGLLIYSNPPLHFQKVSATFYELFSVLSCQKFDVIVAEINKMLKIWTQIATNQLYSALPIVF